MFSVSVRLTCILLLALPLIAVVTFYFRRATRMLFRIVRLSVSAMNQNLQGKPGRPAGGCSSRDARTTTTRATPRSTSAISRRNEIDAPRDGVRRLHRQHGVDRDRRGALVRRRRRHPGGDDARRRGALHAVHRHAVPPHRGPRRTAERSVPRHGERRTDLPGARLGREDPRAASPIPLPRRLRGEVRFEHLDFRYDHDVPVLQDVSLTIAAGEKLAIVDRPGRARARSSSCSGASTTSTTGASSSTTST